MSELAIHEAGHAVVARILGVRVTHIEIAPDKEHGTCNTRDASGTLNQAAIYYAGYAAESRINPDLHAATSAAWDDLGKFCRLLPRGATRERVKTWTDATVAAHWDEIERLAAEIERCGGLYTEELKALGYWWSS